MAFYSGSSMINSTRLPGVTACNYMLSQNHTHNKLHENMGTTYHMFGKMKLRTQQMEHQCNNNYKGNFLQVSTSIIVHGGSKYTTSCRKRSSAMHASWIPSSEIASNAFTFGTVAVLPFYAFMVLAPRASFTKNLAASSAPYIVLGLLYAYLLRLSWAPDTISLIFASKYLMPELSSMAKLFSREMSVAAAWIHLLMVDLFAARQVYFDGLQENIETRHSVFICLFSCPLGILTHFITKALIISIGRRDDDDDDDADQGTSL